MAQHLYETVWDYALPFSAPPDADLVRVGPTAAQHRILESLASGHTDEVVALRARELGWL